MHSNSPLFIEPFYLRMMIYSSSLLGKKIDAYLRELPLNREPKGLYAPINYELSLRGKRLRPILLTLSYLLYKEKVDTVLPQAVGIEIYHNFTLLHDDVMDRSDMRRGRPTVHKAWNEHTAILSGDAMTVLAYRLMADCDSLYVKQVLDAFGQAALEVCEGQQRDMDFEARDDVTVEEYLEMIRLKTSTLLAGALKIGAILGDASAEDVQKLYDFGIKIGLAFQLQDDYLDVYGDPEIFGKPIGGDIIANKKTFLLISACRLSNAEQYERILCWLRTTDYRPEEKIRAMTSIYDQLDIGTRCLQKIDSLYAEGLTMLDQLSGRSEYKRELENFVNTLMKRNL